MFVPDPEIIHARVVMYFMARLTKGYWQDGGCCLQTFMQEKLFGLRQGVHLHVYDVCFCRFTCLGGVVFASQYYPGLEYYLCEKSLCMFGFFCFVFWSNQN